MQKEIMLFQKHSVLGVLVVRQDPSTNAGIFKSFPLTNGVLAHGHILKTKPSYKVTNDPWTDVESLQAKAHWR